MLWIPSPIVLDAGHIMLVGGTMQLIKTKLFPPGGSFTHCWLLVSFISIFGTNDARACVACTGVGINAGWYVTQAVYSGFWNCFLPYWEALLPKQCVGLVVRLGDILIHPLPMWALLPYLHLVDFRIAAYSFLFERWYFLVVEKCLFGNGKKLNSIYRTQPEMSCSVYYTCQYFSTIAILAVPICNMPHTILRQLLKTVIFGVMLAVSLIRTNRPTALQPVEHRPKLKTVTDTGEATDGDNMSQKRTGGDVLSQTQLQYAVYSCRSAPVQLPFVMPVRTFVGALDAAVPSDSSSRSTENSTADVNMYRRDVCPAVEQSLPLREIPLTARIGPLTSEIRAASYAFSACAVEWREQQSNDLSNDTVSLNGKHNAVNSCVLPTATDLVEPLRRSRTEDLEYTRMAVACCVGAKPVWSLARTVTYDLYKRPNIQQEPSAINKPIFSVVPYVCSRGAAHRRRTASVLPTLESDKEQTESDKEQTESDKEQTESDKEQTEISQSMHVSLTMVSLEAIQCLWDEMRRELVLRAKSAKQQQRYL
eukprot:Lankesteria_metandrocarpae@DN337_c0_g1_i1.p1